MQINWTTAIVAIIGAIAGGAIIGFFTLWASYKTFKYQRRHAAEAEEKAIAGFRQALHDEIETVLNRYQETMGSKIESLRDDEPLNIYYPLVSDFFTVYNGNSFLIGRIPYQSS